MLYKFNCNEYIFCSDNQFREEAIVPSVELQSYWYEKKRPGQISNGTGSRVGIEYVPE